MIEAKEILWPNSFLKAVDFFLESGTHFSPSIRHNFPPPYLSSAAAIPCGGDIRVWLLLGQSRRKRDRQLHGEGRRRVKYLLKWQNT